MDSQRDIHMVYSFGNILIDKLELWKSVRHSVFAHSKYIHARHILLDTFSVYKTTWTL